MFIDPEDRDEPIETWQNPATAPYSLKLFMKTLLGVVVAAAVVIGIGLAIAKLGESSRGSPQRAVPVQPGQ
jgi:hypothetical protein